MSSVVKLGLWCICLHLAYLLVGMIGLYPSSNLLGLQTHSKGLPMNFSIEASKVITIRLLYS